jgi:serine phosphatase RsbU (regulator of sigma subunit)
MIQNFWQKISHFGVRDTMLVAEQRSVLLSNQIAMVFFVTILTITALVTVLAKGANPLLFFQPLNIALLFVSWWLNSKDYTKLSRILMCTLPALNITLISAYTKSIGFSNSLAFVLLPRTGLVITALLPVLLFGYTRLKLMFLTMSVSITCLISFDYVHSFFGVILANVPYNPEIDYLLLRGSYFVLLIAAVPAILTLQRLNVQYETAINKQNEEILTQRDDLNQKSITLEYAFQEIQLQNQAITDSINYAKRIQTAMMPPEDDIKKVFPESFILFQPRDIVSGDFYYFVDVGHTVILAAADCTGHGVPGAFMSMIGNDILHEVILGKQCFEPHLILHDLHLGIQKALKQKDTQNSDGMDIALVSLQRAANRQENCFTYLHYAGAMNPLYIHRTKKDENSENQFATTFIEIKADKYPIGGLLSETKAYNFTKHSIDLTEKDTVFQFFIASDGYQDQFGGEHGKKFMVKNFKNLLASISSQKSETQKQILIETLNEWQNPKPTSHKSHEQVDDILVIGFSINIQ